MLTSWSTLTSALADDASQIATTATDNINLLHLLITSVRKSCGTLKTDEALSMLLRGKSDKQRKAKSCAAAQAEVTLVLMKVLPQLIRKFQSDPVQVRSPPPMHPFFQVLPPAR